METAKEVFVDIKESYVDEKLREFFGAEEREVNIVNICLFACRTIEEYDSKSEKKLQGLQKHEAANELAKSVIERSVAFVKEEDRRQVIKNIFHNKDMISQITQFVVDISNSPNTVNKDKWVENPRRRPAPPQSKKGRFLSCFPRRTPPPPPTSEDTAIPPPPPPPSKSKAELKKEREAEKLRKRLEELSLTPEEKQARLDKIKQEKEQMELERKKAKIQEKEQKELERKKAKAEKLRKALEELDPHPPAAETESEEAVESEEPAAEDNEVVESEGEGKETSVEMVEIVEQKE